jgi:hypothetical protein
MVTTQQTRITCRHDIDDVIADIESFADWHAERARLDVSLDISAVFTAEEEAAELRSAATTLDQLVMLPVDLYEEVWSALEAADALTNNAPNVTPSVWMEVATLACKALEQLVSYNIR